MIKSDAIELVKEHGLHLGFQLLEEFKDDKDVVLEAVSNYGVAIQYASLSLSRDLDVALAACSCHRSAYHFLAKELQDLCDEEDPLPGLIEARNKNFYESLKRQVTTQKPISKRPKI